MAVHIVPMPRSFLKFSEKIRPSHPPIFDDDPSQDEIAEARALFAELDEDSQAWYRRGSRLFADC